MPLSPTVPSTYWINLIMANIVTTMGNITTANGYKSNVGSGKVESWAYRPTFEEIEGTATADFPRILVIDSEEEVTPRSGQILNRHLRPIIMGIVQDQSTPSTTMNKLHGDIIVSMYQDLLRGGNAYATFYTGREIVEEFQEPYAAFISHFEIRTDRSESTGI